MPGSNSYFQLCYSPILPIALASFLINAVVMWVWISILSYARTYKIYYYFEALICFHFGVFKNKKITAKEKNSDNFHILHRFCFLYELKSILVLIGINHLSLISLISLISVFDVSVQL